MLYLSQFIYYAIPAAAIVFFFVSLFRFLSAKKKNRLEPGSVSRESMRLRTIMLILSSVIAGVLLAVVIGIVLLMMMAVAYM